VPHPSDAQPPDVQPQGSSWVVDSKRRAIRLAAYGVIRRGDLLLLCRIGPGDEEAGSWTLPGGGLDFGETPEVGAVREVEEETGLVAEVTGPPAIISETGTWGEADSLGTYHHVRLVYPMRLVGGTERVEVDGSTDAIGWFPVEALADAPAVAFVERALRQSSSSAEASSA